MIKVNRHYIQINLPRKPLNRVHFCLASLIFLGCALFLFSLLKDRNLDFFYSEISYISFLLFVATISLIFGYVLIDTLYQHPVLQMSPDKISIRTIKFLRRPRIQDSGISPFSDMKLILVKDSTSQKTWLVLEGRKIVYLGLFDTHEEAEHQRQEIKKVITDFYPELYVSVPIYHEI